MEGGKLSSLFTLRSSTVSHSPGDDSTSLQSSSVLQMVPEGDLGSLEGRTRGPRTVSRGKGREEEGRWVE
jgi:hypothetical protein